jgi:hypothetical protein
MNEWRDDFLHVNKFEGVSQKGQGACYFGAEGVLNKPFYVVWFQFTVIIKTPELFLFPRTKQANLYV